MMTLVDSLVAGLNTERTRVARRTFSYAAPIDPSRAVTVPLTQESLPVEALGTQGCIGGGAAAALAGRAISPTPSAAAEANSKPSRFLVRIYGSPPCTGGSSAGITTPKS
jgi:hypothetical protein